MASSSSPDEASLIASFTSLTSSDEATARFFLESSNWDLDAAASSYFENPSAAVADAPTPSIPATNPPPRLAAPSVPPRGSIRQPSNAPRVAGFSDLANNSANENGEDDNETQDYYAGGEKSGQVVRGPKKTNDGEGGEKNDLTKALLEQARNAGAPPDEVMETFRGRQNFTGAGFRLGETNNESAGESKPAVVGRKNVTKVLTFYRDGFTIDDGEFRRLDDPSNQAFLADIQRGFVPTEMEEPGIGNVSVNLIDKHNEDYVPTKRPVQAFAGDGMRLGGPSSSAGPSKPAPAPPVTGGKELVVDESLPVITVQVRLHDGTKLKGRFNEHHTIADLRQFVALAQSTAVAFELTSSYPRKKLEDDSLSLKESNLNGSLVIQSLVA